MGLGSNRRRSSGSATGAPDREDPSLDQPADREDPSLDQPADREDPSLDQPAHRDDPSLDQPARPVPEPSSPGERTVSVAAPASSGVSSKVSSGRHSGSLLTRIRSLVHAIQNNDEAAIEAAILRLSRSRRIFAPLAFAIGSFALLFDGLRLLLSNWRLTLVQIPPAMWIWLAMYDLKAHVLHGNSFNVVRGAILTPIGLVIVAITVASFFLNAVFGFAIAQSGEPKIGPAVAQARRQWAPIVASGAVVGALLAFATTVAPRWEHPWFTLSLGIVVGIMMLCYVAVPARLIGAKPRQSGRDKLRTSAVAGVIGATVCTPPYLLGRVGLLMLGSRVLFIPGIFVLAIGVTLHAGATGAVRAIKMSTKLTRPSSRSAAARDS